MLNIYIFVLAQRKNVYCKRIMNSIQIQKKYKISKTSTCACHVILCELISNEWKLISIKWIILVFLCMCATKQFLLSNMLNECITFYKNGLLRREPFHSVNVWYPKNLNQIPCSFFLFYFQWEEHIYFFKLWTMDIEQWAMRTCYYLWK